jgi:hypothetical protein
MLIYAAIPNYFEEKKRRFVGKKMAALKIGSGQIMCLFGRKR